MFTLIIVHVSHPVSHVHQEGLERVRVHPLLVGGHGLLKVLHFPLIVLTNIRIPGRPNPDMRVDSGRGQGAGGGVRLKAIHNGLITYQNLDYVGGFPVPDEELAIIRTGYDVFAFAENESQYSGCITFGY